MNESKENISEKKQNKSKAEKIVTIWTNFLLWFTLFVSIFIHLLVFDYFHTALLFVVCSFLLIISFGLGSILGIIALIRKNPYIRPRYYGKLAVFSFFLFLILLFSWGMLVGKDV